MSEASFQGALIEYATLLGWLVYHTRDSRGSDPGFPDLVLVRGSRIIFAELKTGRGRVRSEQQLWLEALRAAALVEVYLWRDSDWNEIIELLRHASRPEEAIAA